MFEGISGYIISIVGIVLLGVLIDLILPDGQINKYVRGIMAFFVVLVMISPFANIVENGIDTSFFYNAESYGVDNDFLQNINQKTANQLKISLENQIENKGFYDVIVEIDYDLSATTFNIKKININTKNMVINNNEVHINKYTEIKNIVLNFVSIKEENIVFDE